MFATAAPLHAANSTTANCYCMTAAASSVTAQRCSWRCPDDASEKCGGSQGNTVSYSVYQLHDLNRNETRCEPCPVVVGAISVTTSALDREALTLSPSSGGDVEHVLWRP